jgi:DNA-directed RNA polymerase specialized sigma24 family protein
MAFDSLSPSIEHEVFENLYRAHARELIKLAASILKDEDADAEDVVQDAFLELLVCDQMPREPAKYLAGIVKKKAAAVVQTGREKLDPKRM